MADAELAYMYGSPSIVRDGSGRREVLLSTSGGITEAGPAAKPFFFSGFLADPAVAAHGMLACAAVARSRYIRAPEVAAILRDPVVTSNGDRLRFEAFSSCCGVHARLDLLPAALAEAPATSGTTNVDFNDAMRAALAGAAIGGPLLLSVGWDELVVDTFSGTVAERKVPLPDRWLKGFGEVQALARRMRPVGDLSGTAAQRFIRSLPRTARRPLWAVPARGSLSLAVTPRPGAACIAGPHRLAELGPLLRFARRLRVYGPPADTGSAPLPSAWELDLGSARFTLTLSPEPYRGFSGEGALLELLADEARHRMRGLPVAHRLVHPPPVEIGADRTLQIVDERVYFLVGRRPVNVFFRVGSVAVERHDGRVDQSRHVSLPPVHVIG
jgi:hypothetical protein